MLFSSAIEPGPGSGFLAVGHFGGLTACCLLWLHSHVGSYIFWVTGNNIICIIILLCYPFASDCVLFLMSPQKCINNLKLSMKIGGKSVLYVQIKMM